MGIMENFKLYQDNDPKHKARIVQEFLLYNCPSVLQPHPQSPDLNPIEYVWEELDRRIRKTSITSIEVLKKRLKKEWRKLSVNYLKKLISTMPKRLHHVIKHKGYPTKY
jgi:hypothetical protein